MEIGIKIGDLDRHPEKKRSSEFSVRFLALPEVTESYRTCRELTSWGEADGKGYKSEVLSLPVTQAGAAGGLSKNPRRSSIKIGILAEKKRQPRASEKILKKKGQSR